MKTNLEILDFEDKRTADKKRYTRFKTSQGWMSCFDAKTIESLKEFEGKIASVELVQSGEFQNIRKCYGEAQGEESGLDDLPDDEPGARRISQADTRHYVNAAKDIFLILRQCIHVEIMKPNSKMDTIADEQIMTRAIQLVKQAIREFEKDI